MTTSREEMVRSIRDSKTERDEAKNEVENLMRSRETLTRSLRDREAERDEATFELKRLYDENRDLNESMNNSVPKMKEEQLREEISDLTSQNLELKHLLASVNESEERLRNAVKVAENNFMVKTTELEDAQYRISQIEQELSEFQTAGVEIIQIEKSKADLVEGIESVTKEKEDIEKLLREEREAKAKLQQQMGEEQRALIQEGENMMTDLRRKLEECEIKFKQSEADAYTARQHIEEINDERNRLDEKYLEASAQLNSSDSSKQRQEARITALESELNHAKSESYALKESIIDMKEKMRRSTRDSEKAMRESEIANSEVSTIRRKLSSLENVNETHQLENTKLKKKIKQSEENNTLVTMLQEELKNKESEIDAAERDISVLKLEIEKQSRSTRTTKTDSNGNDIQIMKNELEKMNKLMIQKDKRIKKLEAVRLTKDRLAHISKMKVCANDVYSFLFLFYVLRNQIYSKFH
jgi:chromosome segregation ATPase